MARSLTRKRHCRHRDFTRLARRTGYTGTNETVVGYQAALNIPDELQYVVDAAARITLVSDGDSDVYEAMRTDGDTGGVVGNRTNTYTFEDVDAASIPGDLGLT